jgi:hypothetical protein
MFGVAWVVMDCGNVNRWMFGCLDVWCCVGCYGLWKCE